MDSLLGPESCPCQDCIGFDPCCDRETIHQDCGRCAAHCDCEPSTVIRESPRARSAVGVRFWSKVVTSPGCWIWVAGRNRRGYGLFGAGTRMNPMSLLASRASWMLARGPIPAGLYVCHHCDNPPCVRPDHLFLGTQSDNMLDAYSKGRKRGFTQRRQTGEENHRAKLTADTVRTIREARLPARVLAQQLGVSKQAVQDVRSGRTWRHVD